MSTNFTGLDVVRLSIYLQQGEQTGIMDRSVSGLNPIPGVAWNSTTYLANLIVAGLIAPLQALFTTGTELLGLKVYKHQTPGPSQVDKLAIGATFGTVAPPIMPTQVSGLISWTSAIAGKRGAGRDYVPFPALAETLVDGLPTAGYLTRLDNFASFLLGGVVVPNVGVGGGFVTVVPCTKYVTPVIGLAFPMLNGSHGAGFATQRRRGYYGKRNVAPIF